MSLRVLPSVDAWFEGRPQALKSRVTAVSAAASHVAGRLSIVGCSLSLGSGVGWCSGCSTVLPRLLHHDDSARCAERTRDIAAPKLDREARRRREPAVFGLRIALPRHLPGISPSGCCRSRHLHRCASVPDFHRVPWRVRPLTAGSQAERNMRLIHTSTVTRIGINLVATLAATGCDPLHAGQGQEPQNYLEGRETATLNQVSVTVWA